MKTPPTHHQSHFQWRFLAFLAAILLMNILVFTVVSGIVSISLFQPAIAHAQDGPGQQPDAKLEPMDFYPEPFQDGALAFSVRDPWDKTDLTYYFHNCPSRLECAVGRDAVRQGFQAWAEVSALTFSEVFDVSRADIEVTWTINDPEGSLGEPGGVLAYNYFPRYGGDMFIDDSEPWTVGDKGEFDLVIAATHEIGHGIGLGHSEFTTAIMYAYAGNATQIGADDVAAIQSLYGPPEGTTPSTTTTTATDINNPNGTIPAATNVDTVDGTINNTHPYDIWTLEVQAGVTVTITMTATSGDLDPYIGILSADQSTVLAENDNHIGKDAQVVYTFTEAGMYSVVATRFGVKRGSTAGSYQMTVEFSQGGGQGGTPSSNAPSPQTVGWRVTNFAGTQLCRIYFSLSDSPNWGEDQTEGEPLNHEFYYEWQIEPGTYDLQVWDCFGNKLEQYKIDASRSVDVQVYQDRITVVPLDTGTANIPTTTSVAWRVSNYANVQLCKIYFNFSSEKQWGQNRIGSEPPLQANFYYEWQIEPGTYDIRVEDCSGGFLEKYNISVIANTELQVYPTDIIIVPLR